MIRLRICYVLATAAAGTGYHAAMLAGGADARGMSVAVFGPQATLTRFFPGAPAPADPADPDAPDGPVAAAPDAPRNATMCHREGSNPIDVTSSRDEGADVAEPASLAGPGPGGIRFGAVEIVDRPQPGRDAAAVRRLRRLLATEDPQIVHAHGTRAGAFAALALGPRGRGRAGLVPALVVTMHNAPPGGLAAGLVYRGLERVMARRADAVLCASPDLADRMRRLGASGVERAVVPAPAAPPPAAEDVARVRAELGAGDRPVVLAVGRLAAQKGFGVLLAAAGAWTERDPRPLVAIAGEGPLEGELTAAAQRHGVDVRFLGPRRDVPALLAVADVVVVPSQWEARALIVQEALLAGRPVVASRVGGIPELTGEDAALLVPAGDAGALSDAVRAVLDDPALAARLAAAARARGAGLPSAADAVDAALAVYERLAAEPPLRA
jgi:glycosyltransferase involved in cell wall biosynthesis